MPGLIHGHGGIVGNPHPHPAPALISYLVMYENFGILISLQALKPWPHMSDLVIFFLQKAGADLFLVRNLKKMFFGNWQG